MSSDVAGEAKEGCPLEVQQKARVSLPERSPEGCRMGAESSAPAPPPKAQASAAASRSLEAVASLFRKACQARKPPTRSEAAVYPNREAQRQPG